MLDKGWTFNCQEGSTGDEINHRTYLYEVYLANDPKYTGRVTVPLLWDKKSQAIVNNESSEIIRMMNNAFNNITDNRIDYCPTKLAHSIDKINNFVYENINNGVYCFGFATSQEAYEKAYKDLFDALDQVEMILSKNR